MPILHLGLGFGNPQQANLQAQLRGRGPLVNVELVAPEFVVRQPASAQPAAGGGAAQLAPLIVPGIALIDTGASNTSISTEVATQLGLQATGVVSCMSASGPYNAQQYTCGMRIVGSGIFELFGVSAAPNLHAQGLSLLLGRDVLANCVLVYTGGTGVVTLSW